MIQKPKTPDWRDPSAYPVPGETSMEEWAEHFAWRDPAIRQRWDDFVLRRDANPELKNAHMFHISIDAGGVKGVEYFKSYLFGVCRALMQYDHQQKDPGGLGRPNHPRLFDIRFNLEAPLDWQLEEAKELLNRFKDRLTKNGTIEKLDTRPAEHLFPLYLRLLDAEAEGSNRKEIIETIGEGEKRKPGLIQPTDKIYDNTSDVDFNNKMNRAKALRDGGWNKLLHHKS